MSRAEGNSTESDVALTAPVTDTVEVVSRVSDALGALADLISEMPGSLDGASIAKSDHGTLLLNRRAWEIFGDALHSRIPELHVVKPAHPFSKPLKFVLVASPLPRSAAQAPEEISS
jgi:hypothetical protein